MTVSSEDSTLTLKEAAALLRVSYSTVYAHRKQLGFFQIGSVWRVWRRTLQKLGSNVAASIEETAVKKRAEPIEFEKIPLEHLTSKREIEAELDRLLARPIKPRTSRT